MPSEFFTNLTTLTNVNLLGLPPVSTLLIFGLFFAIGVSVALGLRFKNKMLTVGAFFMMLSLEAFLGIIDWIFMIIPLLLISAFIFYTKGVSKNNE